MHGAYESVDWEHTGLLWAAARGYPRGSVGATRPMNTEHSTYTRTARGGHYYHITYKSPEPRVETRHMALVSLMRFFNKFYRLTISALGLHVILLYVRGCVKHAVHAEDDDRADIVIRGLVEMSPSAVSAAPTAAHGAHISLANSVSGHWTGWLSTTWSSKFKREEMKI